VYAIAHRQIRREPPQLVVDRAVQRGTKTRDARLVSRKNDDAYLLDLTADVLAAVDWHVGAGYGGPEFLFSKTDASRATSTATSARSRSCSGSSVSASERVTKNALWPRACGGGGRN
jgi:hypothetical protein